MSNGAPGSSATKAPATNPGAPHCDAPRSAGRARGCRHRGAARSRCPCSPRGRARPRPCGRRSDSNAEPVDRAVRGERQQHRRHAEDRAATQRRRRRSCGILPGDERVEPVEERRAGATARARVQPRRHRGTHPPRRPTSAHRPAPSSRVPARCVCGHIRLALGLSAITAASRAGRSSAREVDDRRASPRRRHDGMAALGHLGRWWSEAFRLPREREPGLGQRRGRDRSTTRWTRTCQGAPPPSAVSMRTPGMGDQRVSATPSATSLSTTPSRTRRTPVAGSVTASIESVAPESVHGEVAAEAEPARVRELVVLRLGSARRTTTPAAAPSARPPGRRLARAPCRACAG